MCTHFAGVGEAHLVIFAVGVLSTVPHDALAGFAKLSCFAVGVSRARLAYILRTYLTTLTIFTVEALDTRIGLAVALLSFLARYIRLTSFFAQVCLVAKLSDSTIFIALARSATPLLASLTVGTGFLVIAQRVLTFPGFADLIGLAIFVFLASPLRRALTAETNTIYGAIFVFLALCLLWGALALDTNVAFLAV